MFKNKKSLLFLIPLFLVLTIGLAAAGRAAAVEFDQDGIIEEGEVINDDVIIGGDTVQIDGTVNGDVIAFGSVVRVNGSVGGSLVTAAQTILIDGDVAGSVYAGSSTLTLDSNAEVGRNLYYAGFNLTAREGSFVGRDLLVGAYQALLSGEVDRDLRAGVGALEINGTIGNDVIAEVAGPSEDRGPFYFTNPPGVETVVPSGLRVAEEAVIGGSLTYKSSESQADAIAISPPGGISFEYDPNLDPEIDPGEVSRVGSRALAATWFVKQIRGLITLFLLGVLVIWQLPNALDKVENKAKMETWPSFGWGLVSILVVYLGAVLVGGLIIAGAIFFGVITLGELAAVILGLGFSSMGLILALFGLLVSYGSKILVAYLVGNLILGWLAPEYDGSKVWPLLIGLLLYTLLRAIPIIGWLFGFAFTLLGIGAMWLTYRDHPLINKIRPESEAAE